MTDKEKLEAIKAEIERMNKEAYGVEYGWAVKCETLCRIQSYMDSLPEEPVSEDLNEAAQNALNFTEQSFVYDDPETKEGMMEVYTREQTIAMFKFGAQWQQEQGISFKGKISKDIMEGKLFFHTEEPSDILEKLGAGNVIVQIRKED